MEANDRPPFVGVIETLAAGFGKPVDEALLDAYWMGLEDLPLPAVMRACARAIKESRFMPVVADLRNMMSVRCPECDIGLTRPESIARGYCAKCWRNAGGIGEEANP